jgi:hypothetical protein
LINFRTGTAVGAIVTDNITEVATLMYRIVSNTMEYKLEKKREGYLLLKEKITGSVIRLQTDDKLLSETFWNHYHGGINGRFEWVE